MQRHGVNPARTLLLPILLAIHADSLVADANPPSAHFELRLAQGQTDAVLTLGDPSDDTLVIEVWVDVDDPPPGQLVSTFAVYPRVTDDAVVVYNLDFASPVFPACFFPGPPNEPRTGDVSAACAIGGGTPAGLGGSTLYATFSVSAVGTGTTGYTFGPGVGEPPPWSVYFTDFSVVAGPNVTGSVESALRSITVVAMPRSADADRDGDVDLMDYAMLANCIENDGTPRDEPRPAGCLRLDLNEDNRVDVADMHLFWPQLTGPLDHRGDFDVDGDVDLDDYGRLQTCARGEPPIPPEPDCEPVDLNGDGLIDACDVPLLVERITGPGR